MATGDGVPRVYSISTETATGVVNTSLLFDEIEADVTIVTALRDPNAGGWFNSVGDTMNIWFVASLSAAEITALDAVVLAHQGTATSGDFRFFEDNPASSTTAQTWQTAMSHTTTAISNGTYRLTWYCEMRIVASGALDSNGQMRFAIDSNVKGSGNAVTEEWTSFSGWDRYVAQEAETPTLTIEFRRNPTPGGDDTIEIRKKKMGFELMKV